MELKSIRQGNRNEWMKIMCVVELKESLTAVNFVVALTKASIDCADLCKQAFQQ